jgi:hypothetical protein
MFPPVIAVVCCALELLHLAGITGLVSSRLRIALSGMLSLSLLAAYYSGFYGLDFATEIPADLIKFHQGLGRFSTLLGLPLLLFALLSAKTPPKPLITGLFRASLAALTLTLLYTAHLGGELVLEHGAGVRGLGYKVP